MKPIQPNHTNDLRKISKQITELASEIQEIKVLLRPVEMNSNVDRMYPWNLENSTTTSDFSEE